jgi:hypothetical protein
MIIDGLIIGEMVVLSFNAGCYSNRKTYLVLDS